MEQIVKLVAGDNFGQIFITDTNREHLDKILENIEGKYKVFGVDNGSVAERKGDHRMKRNDAEQIGDMIRKFFRLNGLESPLNEYRLVQAWKDVVGPAIAGLYKQPLY